MEHIVSRENRWIKLAKRLKAKKYRDRSAQFLMEGVRSVEDALAQGYQKGVALVTESALASERVRELIRRGEEKHWLFLETSQALMDDLAGTEHGQGVLAILQQPRRNWEELLQPLSGHYVLLDGIQDPGNLGSILRTAAASGCRGVLLMKGCTDPFAEKVVRSSMGSILRIPVYQDLNAVQVRAIRDKSGLPLIGTALTGAKPYRQAGPFPQGIFVLGNEGQGISEDLLSLCDVNLYIPMAAGVESLNVAASAAVLLFHFMVDE